jgi:hypothetical protein
MIYKKLNSNIQDKIDENVRYKHKKIFKGALLFDLLKFLVNSNIDFIKSNFIY